MASNLTDHQYAADARDPVGFNGNGLEVVVCESNWGTANLTINSQHKLFKTAEACIVSDFSLVSDQLDTHATTPLLTLDVGTNTDDDEFIAASTIGQTGGTELTNTASTGTATEAGFPLAAGEYIIISVKAAAATPAAGKTTVRFKCQSVA
jgi:hypothetical protein